MGNARHTIELNGQLYDTVTGKRLKSASVPMPVLDGFTVRKTAPSPLTTQIKTAEKKRETPKEIKHASKAPQRSATLMRSAVKKPHTTSTQPHKQVVKKHHPVSTPRMQRAGVINKSGLISKFGNAHRLPLKPEVASLPVQAPPLTFNNGTLDLRQQIAAVTNKVQAVNPFERAIHQATSHEQPRLKKQKSSRAARKLHVKPKTMKIASITLAIVILSGFFLYQNAPNLSMRVAATRAGVSASLPGYHPAGFSMSRNIQYSPGQIMVSYHSNSDNRAFSLTQKKTDMDEQKLRTQLVAANGRSYQMYNNKGKTIYIYDDSNAVWVDQGVLYQIEGRSALSSDQLLRLAASI